MLRLHEIMTRDIVTLSPEHSLRDAMSILTSRHISGAPVLSNNKVVGVISLTDLAEAAASAPSVPGDHADEEDGEWDRYPGDEGPEPAAAYFQQLWEESAASVTERMDEPRGPEWNALEDRTVGEAMTRKVSWLPPATHVEEAARVMRDAAIHRVLVMEGDALLVVVSSKDIADAVADNRVGSRTYVFGAPRHL
ncbi:MAG TPA: CBS domain-containing protein [Gemmatimonadaceae bacterium]|nr:CBS domain-containing protein [Gemmatimonadaceae bacterium]